MNTQLNSIKKLYTQKKYDEFVDEYTIFLDANKQVNDIERHYTNIAQGFFKSGQITKGQEYCKKALEHNKKWTKAKILLLRCLYKNGDHNSIIYFIKDHKIKNEEYRNELIEINTILHKIDIIPSIKFVFLDVDYRGMLASRNIKNNEIILQVPFNSVISYLDTQKYNPIVKELVDNKVDNINMFHNFLALEIMYIKYMLDIKNNYLTETGRNEEIIKGYIKGLPQFFKNIPLFYDDNEKNMLRGSYIYNELYIKEKHLKSNYDTLCEKSRLFNELRTVNNIYFDYDTYIWARTCVITRVYRVEENKIVDNVMVPIADMANHSNKPNTTWYKKDNNFVVQASTEINENDTIYESYGLKSNYRYLNNYGFTINSNPYAETFIILNEMMMNFLFLKYSAFYNHMEELNKYNITLGFKLSMQFNAQDKDFYNYFIEKKGSVNEGLVYAAKLIAVNKTQRFGDFIDDETDIIEYSFNYRNIMALKKEEIYVMDSHIYFIDKILTSKNAAKIKSKLKSKFNHVAIQFAIDIHKKLS